jgi:hypothetical protein
MAMPTIEPIAWSQAAMSDEGISTRQMLHPELKQLNMFSSAALYEQPIK